MPMRRVNSLISVASYGKKSFKTVKLQLTPEKTDRSLNDETSSLQSRNDVSWNDNYNNDYNSNNNNTTLATRKNTILGACARGSMMVRQRSRSSLLRKSRSLSHLSSLIGQQQHSSRSIGGTTTTTTRSNNSNDDDNAEPSSSSSTGNEQQQPRRRSLERRDPKQTSNRSINSQLSNDYGHFLTEDGTCRVKPQTSNNNNNNNNSNNASNNGYGHSSPFFTQYAGEELEETTTTPPQQQQPFQKSSSFLELSSLKSTSSPMKRTSSNMNINSTTHHNDITPTTSNHDNTSTNRILILLFDPTAAPSSSSNYEIISLYYIRNTILVRDLLHLIAPHATDEDLASRDYLGFCRARKEGRELINSFSPEVHGLKRDELLIAIPRGYSGEEMWGMARGLVKDEVFLKKLKKQKQSRRRRSQQQGVPSDDDDDDDDDIEEKSKEKSKDATTKNKINPTTSSTSSPSHEKPPQSPPPLPNNLHPTLLLLLLTLLTILTSRYHHRITQPLKPGDVLPVGEWRSHCGLLDILPSSVTNCHPMILELVSDYKMVVYKGGSTLSLLWEAMTWGKRRRRDVLYEVTRPAPTNDHRRRQSVATGSKGVLYIETDGTVMMGDKEAFVQFLFNVNDEMSSMAMIQPWPFVAIPTKWKLQKGKYAKQKEKFAKLFRH